MPKRTLPELADLVVGNIPQEFFRSVPEAMTAAFVEADRAAKAFAQWADRMRAQGRFYKGQEHLGKLGQALGGEVLFQDTEPKGETFTTLRFGNSIICQAVVGYQKGIPDPVKFRQELAATNNSWMTHYQPDLFKEGKANVIPFNPSLFGMVITVTSKEFPDVPEGVYFAIPYEDMSGWHLWLRAEEFSALYERGRAPEQAQPMVAPKLRHKKTENEEE